MKLTTGIVALAITAGTAWAQNPNIIQNTKDALQGVQQQQTAASNQALGTTSSGKPSPATTAKPGAAKPAPVQASTTKPATAPVKAAATPAKAPAVTAKAPAAPAAKPAVVVAKAPAASGATLKPASAQTSSSSPTLKPATAKAVPATAAPAKATVPVKASAAPAAKAAVKATPAKTTPTPVATKTSAVPAKTAAAPAAAPKVAAAKSAPAKPAVPSQAKAPEAAASTTPEAPKPEKQEDKKYSMTGKRDPFVSPVVNRASGSGCSTGKKCLDIEQVALRGVVKADNGMIAVVTNGLNKAYFLRENDPVFNGYVEKITVDSIVFKETFQDRLGKPFTKDVVKRILTPAA
jgi:Tfp pilus assembly protein PilP